MKNDNNRCFLVYRNYLRVYFIVFLNIIVKLVKL